MDKLPPSYCIGYGNHVIDAHHFHGELRTQVLMRNDKHNKQIKQWA